MSEIEHTPGPWILATVPTSVGSCHKIGPFPGAGIRPHTFACVYADGIRPGIDDKLPAAIELAANARLMSASPDLLEALRLCYDHCRLYYPEVEHNNVGEAVRSALAKATGA